MNLRAPLLALAAASCGHAHPAGQPATPAPAAPAPATSTSPTALPASWVLLHTGHWSSAIDPLLCADADGGPKADPACIEQVPAGAQLAVAGGAVLRGWRRSDFACERFPDEDPPSGHAREIAPAEREVRPDALVVWPAEAAGAFVFPDDAPALDRLPAAERDEVVAAAGEALAADSWRGGSAEPAAPAQLLSRAVLDLDGDGAPERLYGVFFPAEEAGFLLYAHGDPLPPDETTEDDADALAPVVRSSGEIRVLGFVDVDPPGDGAAPPALEVILSEESDHMYGVIDATIRPLQGDSLGEPVVSAPWFTCEEP